MHSHAVYYLLEIEFHVFFSAFPRPIFFVCFTHSHVFLHGEILKITDFEFSSNHAVIFTKHAKNGMKNQRTLILHI